LPRFTKFLRDSIFLTTFHLDVVVGLLLSDAGLSKQVKNGQARLAFKQSMSHFSVFWSIFMILSPYCSVLPYTDNATIKIKKYFGIRFDTRTCLCFTMLYDIFYIKNKKVVPQDIFNLLSPIALAYWIMGDGTGNAWRGLYLCTDSFSNYDVIRLMNVMLIRYGIESNFVFVSGKPRIYIPSTQNKKVYKLVINYIHPSMLYKIIGQKAKKKK
jgi:hypothetical protein